jgi:hypothetical protein
VQAFLKLALSTLRAFPNCAPDKIVQSKLTPPTSTPEKSALISVDL